MTGKSNVPRAVADLEQGVVLARVEIAVPPERVFRALTTEEVALWWGADEMYRTTQHIMDARPGGAWRSQGKDADGKPFVIEGEVVEVEPPHKLVETWRPSWDPGPATTVAYRFDAIAGGTRVTVRHSGFGTRTDACERSGQRWERAMAWLAGYLAPAADDDDRWFLLRLIAPRPTFAHDMTPEERAMMQAHAAYWAGKLATGQVIAFGPVLDPEGSWGLGLIKARDEAEIAAFEAGDPAITSGRGFRYEVLPMLRLTH